MRLRPVPGRARRAGNATTMNFLAHLLLTADAGLPLAGGVLGDLWRGRLDAATAAALPAPLKAAIQLHRRVDVATDRHPRVVAARAAFAGTHRRYAGIVLDMLYDHLLAQHWPRYCDTAFSVFCADAGTAVAAAGPWFAAAGSKIPSAAMFTALLESYRDVAGIDHALLRIAERLRAPQPLLQAAADWPARLPALAADLPILLGDLRDFVRSETAQAATDLSGRPG